MEVLTNETYYKKKRTDFFCSFLVGVSFRGQYLHKSIRLSAETWEDLGQTFYE